MKLSTECQTEWFYEFNFFKINLLQWSPRWAINFLCYIEYTIQLISCLSPKEQFNKEQTTTTIILHAFFNFKLHSNELGPKFYNGQTN